VAPWLGATVTAQDTSTAERTSILVAPFFGSDLTSIAFGYDVAEAVERHLAELPSYHVMVPDTLRGRLPPGLAALVAKARQLSGAEGFCTRARQLASVARVAVVMCGTVVGVEEGVFEVTALVSSPVAGDEPLALRPIRGADAERIAAEIVRLLISERSAARSPEIIGGLNP
jgi:hypothetical protein